MDDKPGSFDPRGMPKDGGKPPTSHGQSVMPGGHRLVEGMPPHHIPMYPGSIVPGQFIPYGYRADLGVLAAAAAAREQQMYMSQGGPPRSQEEALMKERMNRERAAQVHQREMERVNTAREMEANRGALSDARAREMRDLAAEQAVQEHFEESLRRAAAQANQAKQAQGRGEMHPQTTRAPSYTTTHGLPKAELNFASAFNYHNNPHAAHPSHQNQQQSRTSPVKRDMSPQEVKHQVPPRSASRESEAYAQHPGYVVHSYKNASPGPSQTARGSSPRRSPNLGPPTSKPSEKQQYAYPAPSRTPTEAFDPNRMYQDGRRYNSSPNIRQSNSPALIHPPSMPAPRNPSPGLPATTSYRPPPGITSGIPVFRPAESSIALTTKPAPSPSPLSRPYYPERTPPPSQLPVKHPSPQMEPLDLGKKTSPEESQAKKQKLESLEVLPPSRMISVAELISNTLDKETPQHPQHGRGLKIIDTDTKGSVLAFTADVKNHVSPPKDRLQQQHFMYSREQVIREPVAAREPQREPPRDVRDHRDVPREYKDYMREQQRDLRNIPCDFRESPRDLIQEREQHPQPSVINTRELPREPVIEVVKRELPPEKPESPPVKVEVKAEPPATPPVQPKAEMSPVAEQAPAIKQEPEIKVEPKEEEPTTPPKVEQPRTETDSSAPSVSNGPAQPVRKLKAAWLQRMVNNDSVTPSIKPPPEQPVKVEPKPEVKVEKEDKNKKVKKGKNGKKSDSSNESEDCEKTEKKPLPESSLPMKTSKNPFNRPTVATLKKSGESFLQDSPCYEVAPRLGKCRECRMAPPQKGKKVDVMPNANIFCRFYAFRRLRYTKTGQLAVAGFSDPEKDPQSEDLSLWLPNENAPPSDLDADIATFLLGNVGDQFCKLIQTEKEAAKLQNRDGQPIAWKRVVQGVREMCDVCETTLFNFHWVCGKCGFVACIDCYRTRFSTPGKDGEPENDNKENGSKEKENAKLNGHDSRGWLLCSNRSAHLLDSLMPTQIIAGDALTRISENLHMTRAKLGLPQNCGCPEAMKYKSENENIKNGVPEKNSNGPTSEMRPSAFEDKKHPVKPETLGKQEDHEESTIKISQYIHEVLLADTTPTNNGTDSAPPAKRPKLDNFEGRKGEQKVSNWLTGERTPRIMNLDFSEMLYPKVLHTWECEGRLLRLLDPCASGNFELFQDQWLRGQPVVVAKVGSRLNMNLWTPESFVKDFGLIKNDLVNCWNGNTVPNQPMSKFWEGFEKYSKRLKDEKGQAMLLKLKDWPPGEDFAEMLPSRYEDLMKSLPMGEYTLRNGRCNLAGRLPDCFVRPDLGPKMYNAYGSPLHFSKGTTNLHLDVSDAVNVMVFVGIPKDTPNGEDLLQESFNCMKEEGVDLAMQFRIRKNQDLPGAIWQIYHAKDTDKIRDLLTKVAVEKNQKLTTKSDPIHDQGTYLDGPLRERLYREYGVRGYTIVQCLGEAVFIPAGAPHQVRNLHSCIKVAEDFVSPENISKCYRLTQEFRDLSESHTNHEDKLQIKNIIYHAVKDCLSVLNNRTDSSES